MLFRKKIPHACAYCAYGGKVDDATVLCRKKGFVDASSRCRRFQYDPLRRVPPRTQVQDFSKYKDEDFSL